MATMFIRHTVSDYEAWRKVYDGFASTQKAMGVPTEAVYQSADNPNEITVTHDFATIAAPQTFAGSPELRRRCKAPGSLAPPRSGSQTKCETLEPKKLWEL